MIEKIKNGSKHVFFKRKIFLVASLITIIVSLYFINDYYQPLVIPIEKDELWGLSCSRAEDLIVQERDSNGHLWATRGMWAYRLGKGDNKFVRQYHIPTGFSIYWLRNFTIIRNLSNDWECVELLPFVNGGATVLSGGFMWYRQNSESQFVKTLALRHYGIGVGRGFTAHGITRLKGGAVVFGEYFRNPDRKDVRLYASWDGGSSWNVSYEFLPGQIQHVHVIKQDPFTRNIWIGTGDADYESRIVFSVDSLRTLKHIGTNSQLWRTLTLIFTKESLIWATDTGNEEYAGIYRWDRDTRTVYKIDKILGAMFFATKLVGGTIVMSTDREGLEIEEDDITRLWIMTDEKQVFSIPCGSWNESDRFATLRFSRDIGSSELAMTCINQKEYNGDLIIIPEHVLRNAVKNFNIGIRN